MFRIINVRHFAEKAFYASTKLGNKYITLLSKYQNTYKLLEPHPVKILFIRYCRMSSIYILLHRTKKQ